ncbi:hypothetical protein LUZ60_010868 [Juncus effusus]|nr:hypothetical protein LUZ60_010868 [Juncus effusus]
MINHTYYHLIFFTLLLPLVASHDPPQLKSFLTRGSSLSIDSLDVLVSPKKTFTCGFNNVGSNAYTFSIWFSKYTNNVSTIVWTANRNNPVNHGSRLTFNKDVSIVLVDIDGTVVWTVTRNSTNQAQKLKLLDNGNLVVTDNEGNFIWQSFESPTDTLLLGQPITKNIKLVSSRAKGSLFSGYYKLSFDDDNVLQMLYDGPEISSQYWPNPDYNIFQNGRTKYNSSRCAVLDEQGQFISSDDFAINASDWGVGITRRLTLDYDGYLRLYSLHGSNWVVTYQTYPGLCMVHGLCGRNGICMHNKRKTFCSCPPSYEMSVPSDWTKGCKSKFKLNCSDPKSIKFLEIHNTDFWGYDINATDSLTLGDCKKLCRWDCNCQAIHYKENICYTKSALFNGKTSMSVIGSAYIKVPRSIKIFPKPLAQPDKLVCNNSYVENVNRSYNVGTTNRVRWVYFYFFAVVLGFIEILFGLLGWWFIFRRGETATLAEQGYNLMGVQFRKFTYKELKKVTKNFKDEIGMGGSGKVYKGILEDEKVVAVKKLKDVVKGDEEFWAKVSIIGRIYHMNLVKLHGFCCEGLHRLLVSEYVENGSLDKHLFDEDSKRKVLGWKERFKISVGSAKGLAYLHEECLEWVIHCDVKPENILLGNDFEPKITDFGLAKLSKRGGIGSNIPHIRGTRGYMAPKWASNLPITAKVDVYSFGIVLLELVRGKRVSGWAAEGDQKEFYEEMRVLVHKLNERHEIEESWISDFVDPRLGGELDKRQAQGMIEIALSCLKEDRNARPSMDCVVQMMMLLSEELEIRI